MLSHYVFEKSRLLCQLQILSYIKNDVRQPRREGEREKTEDLFPSHLKRRSHVYSLKKKKKKLLYYNKA